MNKQIQEEENYQQNLSTLATTYLGQSAELPADLKHKVESNLNGPILAYALSDIKLDSQSKESYFTERWAGVTPEYFWVEKEDRSLWYVKLPDLNLEETAQRYQVRWSLKNKLSSDCPLMLYFSYRQKKCFDYLREITLELQSSERKGRSNNFIEAKEAYLSNLTSSLCEAQKNFGKDKLYLLKRLLSYLSPYRRPLYIGLASALIATVLGLLPALITGQLIDQVVRPFNEGKINQMSAHYYGWPLILILGLTYFAREFFIWIRLKNMSVLGEWVARDLRKDLYHHLHKLDLDYFNKNQSGSLINRVVSDTDRIWDFIAFGVIEVTVALLTLIGLGIMLIILDWRLGLIMAVPLPFLLYSIWSHGETMKKLFLKVWRKWTQVSNTISDILPGMNVVKAFGQEKRECQRFDQTNNIATDELENIHLAWTKFWPILMLSIHLLILGVYIQSFPRLVETAGWPRLGHGTFVSFLMYMTMFVAPLEIIGQMARMINRALSSAYRIFEVLDTAPSLLKIENGIQLTPLKGKVEFQNVHFSYELARPILKDLSFKVNPGEMIGLVGPSGGGKSTITKLIGRFYDVDGGQILIDNHPIQNLDLESFRRQVGIVLQEPYLFHGSIIDNIRYGNPEASIDQVIEAAATANAHEFILKLPMAYETVIGERGHTLSGGERQRLSIARAILTNPSILILDEATSAVDTVTEQRIQEALDRIVKGRTVFAIAHRLSTLRKADRIFVVKNGKIVEQGCHRELMAVDSGEYFRLQKMQHEMMAQFV